MVLVTETQYTLCESILIMYLHFNARNIFIIFPTILTMYIIIGDEIVDMLYTYMKHSILFSSIVIRIQLKHSF